MLPNQSPETRPRDTRCRGRIPVRAVRSVFVPLRAEVLDDTTGQSLPGYSFAECNAIIGDHLNTPVTWTRNAILPHSTKLVRLRLELESGEVSPKRYAFGFKDARR